MGRGPRERRMRYLTQQISQSLVLAHIAQNEIDQSTLPAVVVCDHNQEEADP